MAKDYAKYGMKKRKPIKQNWYRKLFVILLVIVIIVFLCGWLYFQKRANVANSNGVVKTSWVESAQSFFHHKKTLKNSSSAIKTEAKAEPEEIHFDFYNELPNMQMAVSPERPPAKIAAAKPPLPHDKYTLQIAEFKNESEAGQLRLSLLLEGVEAEVVQIGEIFRVQQGTYTTTALAKSAQKELEKQGITSQVQKG